MAAKIKQYWFGWICGIIIGMSIGCLIDSTFHRFNTNAPWYVAGTAGVIIGIGSPSLCAKFMSGKWFLSQIKEEERKQQ